MQILLGILYLQKDILRLGMIQLSAARLCFNNYSKEPGVVTNMLSKLEWPYLERRRILYSGLSMFHRMVYRTVDIERNLYLTSLPRHDFKVWKLQNPFKTTLKL